MITIKPITPEELNKLTGMKELDEKTHPKEVPETQADTIVIAINEAIKDAKYREKNLVLIAKRSGNQLNITVDKNDGKIYPLCTCSPMEANFDINKLSTACPTESDFNEVIDQYSYFSWYDKLIMKKDMDGMIYVFQMF